LYHLYINPKFIIDFIVCLIDLFIYNMIIFNFKVSCLILLKQ